MTKDEALKMALEALEKIALAGMSPSPEMCDNGRDAWHARQAWSFIGIAARALDPIKAALAQPEQEPEVIMGNVAQFKLDSLRDEGFVVNGYAIERRNASLVTRGFITEGGMVCWWFDRDHEPMSPPKRQPLTEDQLDALALDDDGLPNSHLEFARAIEAAHGIGDKT